MDKDLLIASLHQTIAAQAEQLIQQSKLLENFGLQVSHLNYQIKQLLRKLYGRKSEKVSSGADAGENESSSPRAKPNQHSKQLSKDKSAENRP